MPSSDPKLKKFFFTWDGENGDDGIYFAELMCEHLLGATVHKGLIRIPKKAVIGGFDKAKITEDNFYDNIFLYAGWGAVEYLIDEWDYDYEVVDE